MSGKSNVGAYNPNWRDRMRRRREALIDWAITDRTVGGGSVPNSWASLRIKGDTTRYDGASRYSLRFDNDAFGIIGWKGYPDNDPDDDMVCISVPSWVFRRMAVWYLWRWAVGEWFGLRRWLFYKRLHRQVARWRGMSR